MNASLRSRFEQTEASFISSISEPASAEAFYETWSNLQHDFLEAMQDDMADEETCTVAHLVAIRINLLANLFLESTSIADALTTSFTAELETLFAHLTINNDGTDALPVSDMPNQLPAYVEPAYQWLLKNLHDPYPSRELKSRFALASNKSMKDIDNWFISVRKRIGWNTIRKNCFFGKQAEIVAAARFYFDKPTSADRQKSMSIPSVVRIEFAAMEAKAISLYSGMFSSCDGTITMSKGEKRVRRASMDRAALAYPSPTHSPASSPEPESLLDFLPISQHKKRRLSDADYSEFCPDEKRRCISSPLLPSATLPSPAPSPLMSPQIIPNQHFTPALVDHIVPALHQKRKRRLSTSENQVQNKRPRVEHIREIPQSMPIGTNFGIIEDWSDLLITNLGLLSSTEIPPVSACAPDGFTFSDVEYFQLSFPLSSECPLTPISLGSSESLLFLTHLVPDLVFFCHSRIVVGPQDFSCSFQELLAPKQPRFSFPSTDHDIFDTSLLTDLFPPHSVDCTPPLSLFDWSLHIPQSQNVC